MALTFDQARQAFNKMFNCEKYSRFTLPTEEDGGDHLAVKMSNGNGTLDDTDAVEVTGQVGSLSSYRTLSSFRKLRKIYCGVLGALLIIIAILIGLLIYKGQESTSYALEHGGGSSEDESISVVEEKTLDWKDIVRLLGEKLSRKNFDKTLEELDQEWPIAGSAVDASLGNYIYEEFERQEMKPWTEVHYVQLPKPNEKQPNRIVIGDTQFQPKGYLAYSATRSAKGKVVYGNYGRQEDLALLVNMKVQLKGSVMLLRAGRIHFAQKVANAAAAGAVAVLIYADKADHDFKNPSTELYGHVHLGSGDPYTPGFPSFKSTKFPPTAVSSLPSIPAQTITAQMASTILTQMGGPEVPAGRDFNGTLPSVTYRLGGELEVTVEVNNMEENTELHNVFGMIEGFTDPDRFVVLGAQRDSWGRHGYARAAVGTTILVELAKAVHEMVEKDGFRPKRSLLFASWSAGEYGNVGATEWLEGFMSSIDKKAVTYISLDGAVTGEDNFTVSASPMLHRLIESTMKEVNAPMGAGTLYDMVKGPKWTTDVLTPMSFDNPAYPFLAFGGIPSISFHFISKNVTTYPYYGTNMDNKDHLSYLTHNSPGSAAVRAAKFAGQMALRLVHDHLVGLDAGGYQGAITKAVIALHRRITNLNRDGKLKDVSPTWLGSARGAFNRAVADVQRAIASTDLSDPKACRNLNDKIMTVEHSLLSPYVSPVESPFRHILHGQGPHTLAALVSTDDMAHLQTQVALAIWTLKGCASALSGNIRNVDNEG